MGAPERKSRPAESPRRLLFLSHAGADTLAAEALRRAILDSVAARDVGLDVWLDVKDLGAGDWQAQIESGLARMTAFAVLIGKGGVRNWIMPEVRAALDRAVKDRVPFIPVSLDPDLDPASLPLFIQQYQIVRDPLRNEAALGELLRAAIAVETGPVVIAEEPYVGLRAMTEADQHLFFGRDEEVADLIDRLRALPLVAVVADSGAGKSSLVRAGLAPAFRRGALATTRPPDPEQIWQVLTMRPGAEPGLGLARAVDQAAEELGRPPGDRARLRAAAEGLELGQVRFSLCCDLPAERTQVLLVVDQFEELLIQTPETQREKFVALLLSLAQPGSGIRIVLTIRADYFNLLRAFDALWERLEEHSGALFRLRRVTDTGIRDIISRPLTLAGYDGMTGADRAAAEREKDALTSRILQDISDRPGDLALLQMALAAIWAESRHGRDSLVAAYARVGGIFGALAHEADKVLGSLSDRDRDRLFALMVRLVRPGETGGAIRRPCRLDELSTETRALAQRLASDIGGRLVLVDADTVEISHEALIRQWSWLQAKLQPELPDIRVLHQLMAKARSWGDFVAASPPRGDLPADAGAEAEGQLVQGHELELFRRLAAEKPEWLSETERNFVGESFAREQAEQQRKLRQNRRVFIGFVTASVLGLAATGLAAGAWLLFLRASEAEAQATIFAQNALAASAEVANKTGDHPRAAALALAALPQGPGEPTNVAAQRALVRASLQMATPVQLGGTERSIAAFLGSDPERIVRGSERDGLSVCVVSSGVCSALLHDSAELPDDFRLFSMALSRDGTLVAAASRRPTADGSVRIFNTETGQSIGAFDARTVAADLDLAPDNSLLVVAPIGSAMEIRKVPGLEPLPLPEIDASSATILPGGKRVAVGTWDGSLLVAEVDGRILKAVPNAHEGPVSDLAYAESRLASAGADGRVKIWSGVDPPALETELPTLEAEPLSVALAPDGSLVAVGTIDGRVLVAVLPEGAEIVALDGLFGPVVSLQFAPDGRSLAAGTASGVRVLDLSPLILPDLVARACSQLDTGLIREVASETDRPICSEAQRALELAPAWSAVAGHRITD